MKINFDKEMNGNKSELWKIFVCLLFEEERFSVQIFDGENIVIEMLFELEKLLML